MNAILAATTKAETQQLLDGIASVGFAVVENFLSEETITLLANEARQLQQAGAMRPAGIGKNNSAQLDKNIRGDFIYWLDENDTSATQQVYLQHMESLRVSLNRSFYLGLSEMENHYALYPAGTRYGKHLDQFHNSKQRQISCVLYLNHDWQPQHGGQLRLYLDEQSGQPYSDVEPIGGRLVMFQSGRFWHEVLPAARERISIAGWYKTRSDRIIA